MKKTILSAIFILVFGFYVYSQKINTPALAPSDGQNPSNSNTNEPASPASPTPKATDDDEEEDEDEDDNKPTPVTKPTTSKPVSTPTASSNQYKDGSYTGNSVDAYYGNIQVKAVIKDGKITDVQFLDAPHNVENSVRINELAKPILTEEAIQAQSAEVDGATGATFSSKAFKESLASALAQAKK